MRVVNTGSTNFSQTFSSSGWEWRIDNSGGWPDSTAIGEWGNVNQLNVVSNQYVYLIDRGYTANGNVIGYKKLQVIELTNQTYKVRFANLDGSQEQTISLNKDAAYNFLFLSFTQGIVEIEPPKAEWDLLFSQYATPVLQESTGIYEDYSVNGILLNPYLVTATRCFDKPFSELQYSDIGLYSFSKKRDIIGYDWKVFDFELSTYIIVSNNCYMIKNVDGDYYKLRVISFTDNQGVNGYTTFEVAKF
ncbi:MAG: HmuY family protein [Chitinophagales bacterium]|nr:HmuY family protein [Chitinophagales bacterium]